MTKYYLDTPLSEETIRKLKIGDIVLMSGKIYGYGGIVPRIVEAINRGEELPVDLKGAFFDHGPTTSARYQEKTPDFIKLTRVKAISGKGSLNKLCLDAMKTYGCVYLSTVGGGSLGGNYPMDITKMKPLWPQGVKPGMEAFAHALVESEVKDMGPLFVTMDANGHSVETEIRIEEKLPEIYKRLGSQDVMTPYHF